MAACSLVTGDEKMESLEERELDVINASVCSRIYKRYLSCGETVIANGKVV